MNEKAGIFIMARARNKIVNNRLKKQNVKQIEIFKVLKSRMQELMEAEDYAAAMDVMAEMAANKKIDGEVMYWGAMCYFRTGDYDRAAKWINNALSYVSAGVREKTLLAGICIADGRYEDGMRVMEAVLSNENGEFSDADRKFMCEVVKPIRYGYDAFLAKYPQVRALVQEGEKEDFGHKENEASRGKAASALARLKALLNKDRASEKAEPAAEQEKMAGQEKPALAIEKCVPEGSDQADSPADSFDTEDTMQQIMASRVSMREKIKLLNAFAAGCYQSGDYQAAFELLDGAMQLDAGAPDILKNMAYVCLAAGEREQALEYAAKLPMADFGLLYALKNG